MNDLIGLAAYHDGSFDGETKCNCEHESKKHNSAGECLVEICGKFCKCKGFFTEPDEPPGTPIIGPISGYEAYLMAQEKKLIAGPPAETKSRLVEKKMPLHQWDIDNNSAYCLGAPQCDEQCDTCGHWISLHSNAGTNDELGKLGCRHVIEEGNAERGWDQRRYCRCPVRAEWAKLTTAEQSPSYSQSAQSEHSPQYEERQASSHFQCTDQHVRTVGDLLAHMASTLKSNPLAELETMREQLYPPLLALWKCEAIECQGVRTLAVLALSSLLLESESFRHTHTEPPNSV